MTVLEAKEILKINPTTNEEVAIYKQAIAVVSGSWAMQINENIP